MVIKKIAGGLRTALQGMVIGLANIIPGVSGGTMAVVLGIYPRLTEAIGEFFTNRDRRGEFFVFLLLIAGGAGGALLAFARLFSFLLSGELSRQVTYSFFAGLILGSLPLLISLALASARRGREEEGRGRRFLRLTPFFLMGAALVAASMLLGGADESAAGSVPALTPFYGLYLGFCGFAAAASMIIPGFSGSALLVSLGQYENVLAFVDQRALIPIALVGIGAALGLVIAARLIEKALKAFPGATLAVILGMVAGSVVQVGREIAAVPLQGWASFIMIPLMICLGFLAAWITGRLSPEAEKSLS